MKFYFLVIKNSLRIILVTIIITSCFTCEKGTSGTKLNIPDQDTLGNHNSGSSDTIKYISAEPDSSTAELFLWGYLWSDSDGGNKTTWSYRHKAGVGNTDAVDTAACVKRFRKAALLMGATITNERRSGDGTQDKPFFDHISVRFPKPLNIDLLSMPPILIDASPARTSGFLAAVIEGEGNKKGLIIDDWYQAHHDVIKQLLDRMGVRHFTRNDGEPDPPAENKKFKKTGLVDEAGVIEVQKWPYVDRSRVPNRVDSWWE